MPYWRLSSFYLFYFAVLGALLPYWSLYLQQRGFSALEIGELMAVLMGTRIVAPNLWGWLGDRLGRRMTIVRLGSLLATLTFAGVFLATGYWELAVVMFAFSFFWNAVLPQFEANTLVHLGDQHHRYSQIRLWGSIGFILSVVALGALFDATGPSPLPLVLVVMFAAIWVASHMVPDRGIAQVPGGDAPLSATLKRPDVIALLVVCLLMQASHGPYYTFFTIYMEDHGYTRTAIGQLWALGVVAEVGLFMVMHRLLPHFGARQLLLASFALAALRWALTGLFPDALWIVIPAQALHAASFGVYHAAAIALFHRHFAGRHHGQGQALYSSVTFGVGGALGAWYSGLLWDSAGPTVAFLTAAALAASGFLIARQWIDSTERLPHG